jgi:hypothetical protein
MKVKAAEITVTALVLAFTTAIASGYVNLPYASLSSPVAVVVLVIASLGAFMVAPAVGLSLFLLTAVLFFKRNVDKALSHSSTYGANSIMAMPSVPASPYSTQSSGPRQYDEFQETNASNPMIGPKIENFEPAPYGDEQGSPVDGQFPKETPRASSAPTPVDYVYRPDADTGDNTFERFGPDMDEKKVIFSY